MPYLDRDLIRSFLFAFLTIVVMVQVALFVDVLLSYYRYMFGEGESRVGWVMLYYVLSLPRQAAYTIPVGAAVSILWVYVLKARNNELLAWFSGGISPMRLATPLVLVGFFLSAASFAILEYLATPGERAAYRIERVNILGKSEESITRDSNIFRKGGGHRYYHIESFYAASQTMEVPIIMEMYPDGSSWKWRVAAERAIWVPSEDPMDDDDSGSWTFHNVVVREWDANGELTNYQEEAVLTEDQLPAPMEKHLSDFIKERQKPSQMSIPELLEYIQILQSQNKPTYEERTYLHEKIAVPMGAFILALLMCGHVMSPSSISVIKGFGGGLVLIVVYYIPFTIFRELAMGGALPPAVAIYAPNVFFILMGFLMISRSRFAT